MICPDIEFQCPYCRGDGSCSCAWCTEHGNNWVITTNTAQLPMFRNDTQEEVLWFRSRPQQLSLDDQLRAATQKMLQEQIEAWPP